MKTKEKKSRTAKSHSKEPGSIFSEMKDTDMTFIDRKIHDLLITEGYRVICKKRYEGNKLNNYTDINQIEYIRGERERISVNTHKPQGVVL